MNKFYEQPKFIQWTLSIAFLFVAIGIITSWSTLSNKHPMWYFSIFPLVPLFQFLITPFSRLTGMYTYFSPMLLAFGASSKKYDLHNGTPFDYFFVMRKISPGISVQKKILEYYLIGLLNIIEKIEQGEIPESISISGSSYFFSERTAKRLGFSIVDANIFEKINLFLNFIDLIWMYSFSKGEFALPNISKITKAKTKGHVLVSKKNDLIKLLNYLQRNHPTNNKS